MPASEDIRELVNAGDDILVQVHQGSDRHQGRAPHDLRGAALALPGLHAAGRRRSGYRRASRTRPSARRLKALLAKLLAGNWPSGGYIVRTAAQGASPESLRADMLYPGEAVGARARAARSRPAPASVVHEDLPLSLRVLRDELARGVSRGAGGLAAGARAHARVRRAPSCPRQPRAVELYAGPRPIFDLHGIEEEIDKALDRKVPLKSGGHLVIDQTEAMTTIDVNTGAYVGHRNLEETIFRTNLEAAVEHRAPAAPAQPRRHHHHRLHRHARRSRTAARCCRRWSARSTGTARRPTS